MGALALVSPYARVGGVAATRLIAGLDVGVSKTVCVAALAGGPMQGDGAAPVNLIGAGVIGSPAAATGAASDFEACARSIQFAVEEAERSAGARIEDVAASYGGPGLCTRIGVGRVRVRAGVVSGRDAQAALQAAMHAAIPQDMRALHVAALGYRLDDGDLLSDPRGLEGCRLSAEASVTMAPAAALDALSACAAQAGVRVSQIVAAPHAAGLACLDPDDREGALIVDMGAGGLGLAYFGPAGMQYCASAVGGGARLTRALAGVLETSYAAAERAKLAYACDAMGGDPRETVDAPRLGPDGRLEPARVLKRSIQQAVLERVRRQFDGAARMLADAGVTDPAHIVLLGGGAHLGPATACAQKAFGAPAVVGGVCAIGGLEQAMTSAPFATACGLLRYAGESAKASPAQFPSGNEGWRYHHDALGSAFVRGWRWLKESF